jgi:cytochrome b pre-mRNA-processing protein 3
MNTEYLGFYNNLVKLTTNKSLYNDLIVEQDTFGDRLNLFLLHFAFILKEFKNSDNEKKLQELYDFSFKQLELSIREIGYGDQSINKKMKDYLNLFHSMISNIHFWDDMVLLKKKECFMKFLINFKNIELLVEYFEVFSLNLKKYNLNSYLKSVNKHNYGSSKT